MSLLEEDELFPENLGNENSPAAPPTFLANKGTNENPCHESYALPMRPHSRYVN